MSETFKVAYMMSRFPKITETFVLYEMLSVADKGVEVELYPLLRERTSVMHPEAEALVERANFTGFISLPIVFANLKVMLKKPWLYFSVLFDALKSTFGSRRFFLGILAYFWKSVYLSELMSRHGINHLHAHFASFPAASAFIIHRLSGIPYSFTAHGSDLHRDRHMLAEKVKHAKFVVTVSNYNKQVILDHCGSRFEDKIRVIHCGVDTRLFSPHTRPCSDNQQPAALKIVCTGTLHEVKGQRYLLRACAELQSRKLDFRIEFVGDGPDLEELRQWASDNGMTDKVVFHGRMLRAEVIGKLQQADIVVLPSVPTSDGRREGIPVALMEAMSVAVPVISSRLSGIPELVDDGVNGLLAAPGDSLEIAEKIQQLADDSELRNRLGESGRKKILEEFDLEKNAALLVSLFRQKSA